MDEKKKLVILAVLGVLVLAVGAFQFRPKAEEPAPVVKKDVPEYLKANEDAKEANAQPVRNPLLAANLAARDPFLMPSQMRAPVAVEPPKQKLTEPIRRNINVGNVRPVGLGKFDELKGPLTVAAEPVKEEPFNYTIGGVAMGARPAVVFKDAAGSQRLVVEGGDLDGDTKVKAVRMDHVVVVYKGKTLRLKVGGDTVAK